MADELSYTIAVRYANGLTDEVRSETFKMTQSAKEFNGKVVEVGTSEEALSLDDITLASVRFLLLRNLDAANYITIGPEDTGAMIAFCRLLAGEEMVIPLAPSAVLRWQANTAVVRVLVKAYGSLT